MAGDLPVDPERLKQEFPQLTAHDLEAYVAVTRTILVAGKERSRLMREIIENGRQARDKQGRGDTLSGDEQLWLDYLAAVEKMQRSTTGQR